MKDKNQERLDTDVTLTSGGRQMRACPSCGFQVDAHVLSCPRDGTSLVPSVALDPSFQSKYEFLETIGSGGFGVIYKARHLFIDKLVAIKMLHNHLLTDEIVRRFQIEGIAANSLEHPNIIKIHDFGITSSGQPYMIMDYVEGKTLAEVLARDGRLAMRRFCRIFSQVASALEHAHSRHVLHRDIKPSNIMLLDGVTGPDEVRIMDFGIAKIVTDTTDGVQQLTRTGEAIGSPLYMSPEQCLGLTREMTHLSDIYSLGCVMYEAVTGGPPFEGANVLETMHMHTTEKPLSFKEATLGEEFDPVLERMVSKTLEKEPSNRYQSMHQLGVDLKNLENPNAGFSLVEKEIKEEKRAASTKVLHGFLLGGVTIGVIAAAATYFYVVQKNAADTEALRKQMAVSHAELKQSEEKPYDTLITNTDDLTGRALVEETLKGNKPDVSLSKLQAMNELTDSDFEPFSRYSNVKFLDISGSNITDKGLEYLSNDHLVTFYLGNTRVQDLHALKDMKSLQAMVLKGCPLNHAGFRVLSELPNLKRVDLANTGIEDADLKLLSEKSKLDGIVLEGCSKLSAKAVERFHRKHPLCRMIRPTGEGGGHGTLLMEAQVQLRDKHYAKAESVAGELIQLEEAEKEPNKGNLMEALCLRADALSILHRNAEALELRRKARDLVMDADPTNEKLPILSSQIALGEEEKGDFHAGIAERDKANRRFLSGKPLDSSTPRHYLNLYMENRVRLAQDYNALKETDKAIEQFESCLADYEKFGIQNAALAGVCHQWLADALTTEQKFKEALPHYIQAGKIFAADPNLKVLIPGQKHQLASCYFNLKQYDKSAAMMKEALKSPDDPPNLKEAQYSVLIWSLRNEGKNEEAALVEKQFNAYKRTAGKK